VEAEGTWKAEEGEPSPRKQICTRENPDVQRVKATRSRGVGPSSVVEEVRVEREKVVI
jgi:hypothetical protein